MGVLSAEQINEWEAFNRIQPIGRGRFDFYFSYLMTSLHNIAIGFSGTKGAKQFEIEDFTPNWAGIKEDEELSVMSEEQIKQFWTSFAETHNEKTRKDKNYKTTKRNK